MDTLRLFRFFEPRLALWGFGLEAGLGAMYGLFVAWDISWRNVPWYAATGIVLGGHASALSRDDM